MGPPLGFDPILLDFRGSGRRIESIGVTVNAPLRDAALLLRVLRGNRFAPGTSIRATPSRQVVFEQEVSMGNIASPPEGPRGTVALSTWSGTLWSKDWEGGCQKALYTVQAEVTPVIPPPHAEGISTSSPWFTCRLGWWAAIWTNIIPLHDRWQ